MAAVAASVSIPTCKWAQRKDCVFVTVDIPDVTDEVVTVESEKLTFKGKSQGKDYACEMILFNKVNKEESKYKVQARGVSFYLAKVEEDEKEGDDDEEKFWPRLLKDKALNKRFVKIDWNKWCDEDEEDEKGAINTDGFEGMGGMGGMGGMVS